MNGIFTLFKFLSYPYRRKIKKTREIKTIHAITYRVFSPDGGRGGGSAVQSCQNIILGKDYEGIFLKYTYFESNKYWENLDPRLADLWAGAMFAISKTKDESDAAYITHDYTTAFGLAVTGRRFVYVSHLQGPRVEEKLNYGEQFTYLDQKIIAFCERYVFRKAMYVCFPSAGARDYYFSSRYRSIDQRQAKIGPILYNTIYANPEPQAMDGIVEDRDALTFISIGALTSAKGIDQLPEFVEKYLQFHSGRIRWIVVGNGPLETEIRRSLKYLEDKFDRLSIHLVLSCSYPQIQYLIRISDIYLMFHRISIFDLATLEAMKEGKCIVLSNVGGNPEFNKEDNIILHKDDLSETASRLNEVDVEECKSKNRIVYERYFSNDAFLSAYHRVIHDLLNFRQ